MPTVSVIIPNYNHAPYLKERIDSVLNQTFQDFEVIILDDKSTDDSRDVIEQYRGHHKISHIIYNDVNSGSTFKQWKKGIDLAQGEWIWIAESDDWCDVNFLTELISISRNDFSLGLIYCQSYFYHSDINRLVPQNNFHYTIKHYSGRDFFESQLVPFNLLVNASMAIFKKDLYSNISDEYTHYKLAGDWIFWAELGLLTNVAISGKYLNYFRQHKVKVSNNILRTGNNYNEEIRTLEYFRDCLNLKQKNFERALFYHYLRFQSIKKSFNQEILKTIEDLFYKKFSNNLKKQYYIRKIKLKFLSLIPFNIHFQ